MKKNMKGGAGQVQDSQQVEAKDTSEPVEDTNKEVKDTNKQIKDASKQVKDAIDQVEDTSEQVPPVTSKQVAKKKIITNITLRDLLYYNFFSKFGIDFDEKHLKNYHDAINNPTVYNEIQQDVQKLSNIVNPSIEVTTDKIAHAWSDSLHEVEKDGLKTAVGAIPVVGQVIDEADNVNKTVNSALTGVNAITNITSGEIQKIEEKFNKLNPENQLAEQVEHAQDAAQAKVGETLSPVTSQIAETQDAAQAKIGENIDDMVTINNDNKAGVGGGSKILSRIQKSVKEFMGYSQNKKNKSVKKHLGKKSKTSKRFIPIVKNKKTHKILYRIKQSVKEFANV